MVASNDYRTKMDDVILESLKPQVDEIKRNLASGGSLSQSDVIALTLYAQGNHINHIDMRMDSLDEKFDALEVKFDAKFNALDAKFNALCLNFEKFRADIYSQMSDFRSDFAKLTVIISGICAAGIAISNVFAR